MIQMGLPKLSPRGRAAAGVESVICAASGGGTHLCECKPGKMPSPGSPPGPPISTTPQVWMRPTADGGAAVVLHNPHDTASATITVDFATVPTRGWVGPTPAARIDRARSAARPTLTLPTAQARRSSRSPRAAGGHDQTRRPGPVGARLGRQRDWQVHDLEADPAARRGLPQADQAGGLAAAAAPRRQGLVCANWQRPARSVCGHVDMCGGILGLFRAAPPRRPNESRADPSRHKHGGLQTMYKDPHQ